MEGVRGGEGVGGDEVREKVKRMGWIGVGVWGEGYGGGFEMGGEIVMGWRVLEEVKGERGGIVLLSEEEVGGVEGEEGEVREESGRVGRELKEEEEVGKWMSDEEKLGDDVEESGKGVEGVREGVEWED